MYYAYVTDENSFCFYTEETLIFFCLNLMLGSLVVVFRWTVPRFSLVLNLVELLIQPHPSNGPTGAQPRADFKSAVDPIS